MAGLYIMASIIEILEHRSRAKTSLTEKDRCIHKLCESDNSSQNIPNKITEAEIKLAQALDKEHQSLAKKMYERSILKKMEIAKSRAEYIIERIERGSDNGWLSIDFDTGWTCAIINMYIVDHLQSKGFTLIINQDYQETKQFGSINWKAPRPQYLSRIELQAIYYAEHQHSSISQ